MSGPGTGGFWALATGAGKDATLALHRARTEGMDVRIAFNLYDGSTRRVAFHGTRTELVAAHCRALGLEPLLEPVPQGGYEEAFVGVLRRLRRRGVAGVVFGNVHLADVRGWYEERTTGAGLRHLEPLWGEEPAAVVAEVVELGYRARVVSVDLEAGDGAWLGRDLAPDLVDEIARSGADPCGEHGEYHTFVLDGPAFGHAVTVRPGETLEMQGHRLLDLRPA